MDQREYAKKLANDHWGYVNGLLTAHKEDQEIIDLIKYHYQETARHFFGHGVEWWEKERKRRKKLRKKLKKANNMIKKEAMAHTKRHNDRNGK